MTRSGSNTVKMKRALHLPLAGLMSMFLLLTTASTAALAGPYAQSAHGDTQAGVAREELVTPGPYVIGNCGHCHEQHASMGGSEPQPQDGGPSPFALFSPGFVTTVQVKPYQQSDFHAG